MRKTDLNIKNIRSIALMAMVVLFLSPCVVKASIFQVDDVEFQSPLNKTKVLKAKSNFCGSTELSQTKTHKNHKVIAIGTPDLAYRDSETLLPAYRNIHNSTRTKTSSGIGRPLYVLYNRFKIDIAI